ncbi:methyltransferase domain-containing protein [Lacimonas salitolerans]|uniref:Methyltransferase domain-containing protein n=1 Tax=Lacimonas salitolerans TaxID=1323750 RepID=A0ABW4EKA3_9RHOB
MTDAPRLTDRTALTRNRARALARGPEMFLHRAAADELQDRLAMVKRTFTKPAIVTGFPDFWRNLWPDARIVPDDEVLALDEGAHDLVMHAMALHWANDPVGQVIQCRRALRPDGLFLSVAFGGQTLANLRTALAEAEAQVTGGLSPRVVPMAEIRDMGALLQRAGLALPVADSVPLRVSYADTLALMRDLRAMGENNAQVARLRHLARRDMLLRAAAVHAELARDGTGRITELFELVVLTGWAPDDSQPKPLRPGSAQTRLAQALGTTETPLGD